MMIYILSHIPYTFILSSLTSSSSYIAIYSKLVEHSHIEPTNAREKINAQIVMSKITLNEHMQLGSPQPILFPITIYICQN